MFAAVYENKRLVNRVPRRGFSLLEVQVAFAILGIGLAGLGPFVIMQLRQVRKLELRFQGEVVAPDPVTHQNQTILESKPYYIVPWKNPWARKLAGSGPILETDANGCDQDPPPLPSPAPPTFPVTAVQFEATPGDEELTLHVDVEAP